MEEHAELTSLATTLEDVTHRVTAVADRYAGTAREDVAFDLYEVERALRTAGRKLDRLLRAN